MARLRLALGVAAAMLVGGADAPPVWRDGMVAPSGDAGVLYMAAKGGFGTAFGLDLQMVPLGADPLLLKALIAGQLDSYVAGPGSPLIAASRGADVRIVGCSWNKQSYTLFGAPSVHTLGDLQGKTVGISSPGSAPDIFVHAALAGAGVPVANVRFATVGTAPELLSSIAAGVVQGGATPDEFRARALRMGFNIITTSDEATPLSMQRCHFVSGAMVRQHPERVAQYLAAEMAAYAYAAEHRGPTVALTRLINHAPADATEPAAGYENAFGRGVVDLSFRPPLEKLRWLAGILTQFGQMKPGFDPADMVDTGPLEQARTLLTQAGGKPADAAAAALVAAGVSE